MQNNYRVTALDRAHRLYRRLIVSPWPMGISELARDLGLSKSTVHGLVHTLTDLGLLDTAPEDGTKFRISETVLSLWREALLKGPMARAAKPLLVEFSERHGLTALAGVFLQARVLVVEAVTAPGFGIAAYAGQVLPAWAAALGKVLLAAHPGRRVGRLARDMASHGPLDAQAYLDEVEQTRLTGVALDREEYLPGVRALACPLPITGPLQPFGAVWAVGLAPSLDDRRLTALAPELLDLAGRLRRRIAETEAIHVEGPPGWKRAGQAAR